MFTLNENIAQFLRSTKKLKLMHEHGTYIFLKNPFFGGFLTIGFWN